MNIGSVGSLINYVDLTSLNKSDTIEKIDSLCKDAIFGEYAVAALCVFPKFIPQVKGYLEKFKITSVEIATVINFPEGNNSIDFILQATSDAIKAGATEIDVVIDYNKVVNLFLSTDLQSSFKTLFDQIKHFVAQIKAVCGPKHLKVIIESGFLEQTLVDKAPKAITLCSEAAIEGGADFLKTSTGKVEINATISASIIMLQAIKKSGRSVGFKAAGGIRTVEEANKYLALVSDILGKDMLSNNFFRIGASSLLVDIKSKLEQIA